MYVSYNRNELIKKGREWFGCGGNLFFLLGCCVCRFKKAVGLSGFRQSAVYIPLVGQVVQNTVFRERLQLGIDGTISVLPAAPVPVILRLLLLFFLTLLITPFITLNLRKKIIKPIKQCFLPPTTNMSPLPIHWPTPHLAQEHKLVNHAQDEISPEDVQSLQH